MAESKRSGGDGGAGCLVVIVLLILWSQCNQLDRIEEKLDCPPAQAQQDINSGGKPLTLEGDHV